MYLYISMSICVYNIYVHKQIYEYLSYRMSTKTIYVYVCTCIFLCLFMSIISISTNKYMSISILVLGRCFFARPHSPANQEVRGSRHLARIEGSCKVS